MVDDGSGEDYSQFFWMLGEKCIVLHHRENRGKGAAIKTALRYIKNELWGYSVIGIMDADGQHLPDDMEKLLLKASTNPKALILGSRIFEGDIPWASKMGNLITRKVFQMITGTKESDTQTGLRAYSSELLDFMIDVSGERYEYEMNVLITCAENEIPIIEVPIETIYHDRKNSCSHFRKIRDSIRICRQLLKFSSISFSSFLLDYGLFVLLVLFFPETAGFAALANIMARILSGVYNYWMNCRFVFHEEHSVKTALEYMMLAGSILLMNSILLQSFMGFLRMPVYQAKMLRKRKLQMRRACRSWWMPDPKALGQQRFPWIHRTGIRNLPISLQIRLFQRTLPIQVRMYPYN